ncbi:hypothetical protein FD723_39815 (plasmid) [Nostoc sp. C052]|uniref:hypothetical protein n=1 Tax=Nostoc sp. C052 TaxID=2576902 RepID=UPI0015C3BC24|nr:hypothetical protein [Nostoc sp. C052]QLE46360.1 hypothetical protein FD723_39815 [Nostoc sp. C052]
MFPLAYLLPEELQSYLIQGGYFTPTNVPTLDDLEIFLYGLEALFDAWVGHRIAATPYTEERISNASGLITLSKYPVIEVKQIRYRALTIVNQLPQSPALQYVPKVDALWQGGRSILVGSVGDSYKIDYTAGSAEIPLHLKKCLLNLIKKMLQENPGAIDVGILNAFANAPNRDLISVHLPGGISQTFKIGETNSKGSEGQSSNTQLDRALAPLLRFRRQTIT